MLFNVKIVFVTDNEMYYGNICNYLYTIIVVFKILSLEQSFYISITIH